MEHKWIKPLHKNGDVNDANNCQTIMNSSIMGKLLGCVMERKLSTWAEENDKRASGQVSFQTYNGTIDHLVTLQVLLGREPFERQEALLLLCGL